VQRMLTGIVSVSAADFDALHAAAPAECGLWIAPGDMEILSAAQLILASVGAYLTVDRFGTIRVGRLELPAGTAATTLTDDLILDEGNAISRSAPSDDGDGLPAWKITVRYAFNDTVMQFGEISTAASEADRSFAEKDWRQIVIEDQDIKDDHRLAPELSFDTLLTTEADAQAFAAFLMARYGVRRDVFNIDVPSDEVPTLDLDDVAEIRLPRFGMEEGRLFRVIGLTPTLARNTTTIDLWG
jgi:hypothetical protein